MVKARGGNSLDARLARAEIEINSRNISENEKQILIDNMRDEFVSRDEGPEIYERTFPRNPFKVVRPKPKRVRPPKPKRVSALPLPVTPKPLTKAEIKRINAKYNKSALRHKLAAKSKTRSDARHLVTELLEYKGADAKKYIYPAERESSKIPKVNSRRGSISSVASSIPAVRNAALELSGITRVKKSDKRHFKTSTLAKKHRAIYELAVTDDVYTLDFKPKVGVLLTDAVRKGTMRKIARRGRIARIGFSKEMITECKISLYKFLDPVLDKTASLVEYDRLKTVRVSHICGGLYAAHKLPLYGLAASKSAISERSRYRKRHPDTYWDKNSRTFKSYRYKAN